MDTLMHHKRRAATVRSVKLGDFEPDLQAPSPYPVFCSDTQDIQLLSV